MNQDDLDYFQKKLQEEQQTIEEELAGIARKNPNNSNDWEALPPDTEQIDFRDEVAERLEELEDRQATVAPLEFRLKSVKEALGRIAAHVYGLCKVDGKLIERDRLEANPAADTCKEHLEK